MRYINHHTLLLFYILNISILINAQDKEKGQTKFDGALILGGSGNVGSHLIKELVRSKMFSKITNFGRRIYEEMPPEVEQIVVKNFTTIHKDYKEHFKGSICFSTFGSTKYRAGNGENFELIESYQLEFARGCKMGGIENFQLLSTKNANKLSWFLYLSTKGKIEKEISNLRFQSTLIYRPSLLDKKDKNNWIENMGSYVMNTIEVDLLAKTMFNCSLQQLERKTSGVQILLVE